MGSVAHLGIRVAAPLALLCLLSTSAAAADLAGRSGTHSRKKPVPRIDLSQIGAPTVLGANRGHSSWANRMSATEPSVEGLVAPPRYVIGRDGSATTGRRATINVQMGDMRVFAVGGRLPQRQRAGVPYLGPDQRLTGSTKLESGKLYGAGIERQVGPVELGAQYQYSTISADQLDPTADSLRVLQMDDHSSSHAVKATMNLKF